MSMEEFFWLYLMQKKFYDTNYLTAVLTSIAHSCTLALLASLQSAFIKFYEYSYFKKACTLKNKKGCNKFNAGELMCFDGKIFTSQKYSLKNNVMCL